MPIHPTAIIEDGADIHETATIGPYCTVGPLARIGADVVLKSHVAVAGRTTIGERTVVWPFASLGGPPQHTGYKGEDTRLVIGADNVIREHATMNLGTPGGGGVTRIGANCYFMTGAHVAHDCTVGDRVIFANNATLGGHVTVGDQVFLGGLSAVHQHGRIGDFAFVGGLAGIVSDLIPYGSAWGAHAHLDGFNIVGLKRRGAPRATIHKMRAAYRLLFRGEGVFRERLAQAEESYGDIPEVARILAFIKAPAKRPLMTPAR